MSLSLSGFYSVLAGKLPVSGLVLTAAAFLVSSFSHADVSVLASIKPLALIASEVVGDRARVDTLLPIKASPHDYPLRVSDIRRLTTADVVLWVGPELESFLRRPLNNLPAEKRLSAYDLPGIFWPDLTEDPVQESDGHEHHGHDPHLWLDPRNAVVIARALAVRLGKVDREFAGIYQANAERFAAAVKLLDQRLAAELQPAKGRGFAVYHEGYLHFVARYQLQQLAYVTYTPERRPGAKHLYQLRQTLKNKTDCLFIEPYYDMRIATELAQELELKVATLDPIGSEQVDSYEQLMEQMAQAFLACLANGSGFGKL